MLNDHYRLIDKWHLDATTDAFALNVSIIFTIPLDERTFLIITCACGTCVSQELNISSFFEMNEHVKMVT